MARLMIVEDNHELATVLAEFARSRGHDADAFATGQAALSAAMGQPFELAVVDLLLPDMRGSEILRQLRDLRVATVAISGVYKGDRFAVEATEVHGARAFFEKPFDLAAVFDTIEGIVGAPAGAPAGPGEERSLDEIDVLDPEPWEGDEEDIPEAETAAAVAPLPPDELPLGRRKPLDAAAHRAGQISDGTVPRLLTAYFQARHVGELRLQQGQVHKVIAFAEGLPVFAASNLASERFGRFALKRGAITDEELAEALSLAKESGQKTSQALLRLGHLTQTQYAELVQEQVRDIICSTFAWTQGEYSFTAKKPRLSELVPVSLFPANLILEGVLKTSSLAGLRRKLPSERRLFPTADPPYGAHELALSGPQAMLLAYADGSKSVQDLLQLTDLPEQEALATLRGLELALFLEERPGAGTEKRISFGL